MVFKKLIVLQILNILTCKGSKTDNSVRKTNYKTSLQNGAIYLNSQHPLWILQDHKDEKQLTQKYQSKDQVKQEHFKTFKQHKTKKQHLLSEKSLKPFNGPKNFKTKAQKRLSRKGIQIPHNYIPFKNASKDRRKYKNSKFLQNMPVFDAVPGEESFTKSTPIFIYTGNKGRMLLNTMLSKEKYPMQEPVPGQVLHPPQSLVFKPKPLIENLQRKLNVTMIPFYAHEAVDPMKKLKKAKQYTAFFSPQEVLSQPFTDLSKYHNSMEQPTTTFSPLTLDKPFGNHRLENLATSTTTTPWPHKKLAVTYNGGEDKFQIIYEDDNMALERPLNVPTTRFTTTQSPLTYQSYAFDDNYYAFPVYTMSKLLDSNNNQEDDHVSLESQRVDKIIDNALKEETDDLVNNNSNEDTWFILNSRYKGPLKKTTANNIHSSKYVQTSPSKVLDATTK